MPPPVPPDRDTVLAALRAVVDRRDPEGLLGAGAPADEYEPEADAFARLSAEGTPITGDEVVQVWEHWFGPGSAFLARATRAELDAFAAELDTAGRPTAP